MLVTQCDTQPPAGTTVGVTPYVEHRDYVLGVLARRCGWLDPSDREGLLHDAYMVFLEKQRDGKLDAGVMRAPQVRAYLTQTALNKAMDEGKRAGRRRSVSLDDEDLGIDPADPGRGLDERLESRFDDARVREIVAELPERQQLVIKLRFFFNRSPQEIQRYMAITERVYRRELERATRQLAERLELVRKGTFCESRRSLILAYVTGVAGPNRRQEARRHLDTCPACANWASELSVMARRAAAVVPAPLLSLPLHRARVTHVVSVTRGVHEWMADLLAGVRGQSARLLMRADPSRLAAFSGARPSAIAVLVTGCLAGGTTAGYCLVHGLPAPVQSLIGDRGSGSQHHPRRTARRVVRPASRAAVPPPIIASRPVATETQSTKPRSAARVAQSNSGHARAQARHDSVPAARPAAVSGSVEARRIQAATEPEFGVGSGTPVSSSSSAAGTTPAATKPAAPKQAPMPEFDP